MSGAVGELIFHNRYSYANGNPVNLTDSSGLCPRLNGGMEARECEFLRDDLRAWGVNVVYDIGRNVLEPGSSCLPEQCELAVNQAQGIRQRFTLGEMSAIHSAARIFRTARSSIGFAGLNGAVTIEKRRDAATAEGSSPDRTALGLTVGRTIILNAGRWGEGRRTVTYGTETENSIDLFREATDPRQYRAWLVLHEIGHVLLGDLGFSDEQSVYGRLERETSFTSLGLFPTQYAYSSGGEYIVEAVTGTIWNSGYHVVHGYDSSAGGRTGRRDTGDPFPFSAETNDDPPRSYTAYVRNVADANWKVLGDTMTLEEWIVATVLK